MCGQNVDSCSKKSGYYRLPAFVTLGRDAKLYLEAGADAIFPEALTSREMLREFVRRVPDVPLLANMTECGRTPFFSASGFEAMGYRMVIWACLSVAGGKQGAGPTICNDPM
jgi:2-methylisocitrate lyase-like PEP mutase family enzyme